MRSVQGIMNRSPKISVANSPFENQINERSYNMMSSEAGNIFLDPDQQRIQQGSFHAIYKNQDLAYYKK